LTFFRLPRERSAVLVVNTVGRLAKYAVAAFCLLVSGSSSAAQTPRQVETLPLQRPKPLVSMAGTQVRPTLEALIAVIGQVGFAPDAIDWEGGQIDASKQTGQSTDRVVIWLEWHLTKPAERFNIYMETGRYEKFFGGVELKRVVLTESEERQAFGALRQTLIAEAIKRGTL
jgi:hypothetical protein